MALAFLMAGPLVGDDNDCRKLTMEVNCSITPSKTVLVGDPFEVTATVRNTGDFALDTVTLALAGTAGINHVGGDDLSVVIPKLGQNETRSLTCKFVSDSVGERRINASSREQRGWAAAGCICGVQIKGLPALQLEMIDIDANRQSKGIFEMGEEFLYVLNVVNDVGTALTPKLKIVWELPPELEYVSGTGDRGTVVTGSDQTAESTEFELKPNDAQNFELLVRVIGVPPTNLVQTRAAVVSALGGQELATETESTTIKGK
jgi:hypothetical protein